MDWGVGVVWVAAQKEEARDTRVVCRWWVRGGGGGGGQRRGEASLLLRELHVDATKLFMLKLS